MIAVDTNVLLRLIVADDPRQLAIAKQLITAEQVFVPLTVTLECEWVLRSFYKYPPEGIATAIRSLIALENITFEQVDGVLWALSRLLAGADFADVIHILQAHAVHATSFATFDEGIAEEAGDDAPLPVRTLG